MSSSERWVPLRGRVIVTRESQLHSDVIVIPDTYRDPRSPKTADRGKVLAAGDPPDGHEPILHGDDVFYLGPADRLAIIWIGARAFAVSYAEVLAVVEP